MITNVSNTPRFRNGSLVDSRRVLTKQMSRKGAQALRYLRAISTIILVKTSMGEEPACDSVVAAMHLCRRVESDGVYHFPKEHRFVMRKVYTWDSSLGAISSELKRCGISPTDADILRGIRMAERLTFGATTIAELVGYSMAVQRVCDEQGLKLPFSPYDASPLYRKMRYDALKKSRQARQRMAAGCRSQANSAERNRPWERLSPPISRASWYRLPKEARSSIMVQLKIRNGQAKG